MHLKRESVSCPADIPTYDASGILLNFYASNNSFYKRKCYFQMTLPWLFKNFYKEVLYLMFLVFVMCYNILLDIDIKSTCHCFLLFVNHNLSCVKMAWFSFFSSWVTSIIYVLCELLSPFGKLIVFMYPRAEVRVTEPYGHKRCLWTLKCCAKAWVINNLFIPGFSSASLENCGVSISFVLCWS